MKKICQRKRRAWLGTVIITNLDKLLLLFYYTDSMAISNTSKLYLELRLTYICTC